MVIIMRVRNLIKLIIKLGGLIVHQQAKLILASKLFKFIKFQSSIPTVDY